MPNDLIQGGHTSISEVITVYPPVGYEVKKVENGNGIEEIVFTKLIPKQSIIITYMYPLDTYLSHFNITVRSDEGIADLVQYIPEKRLPTWLRFLLLSLILIGAVAIINFLLNIILLLNYLIHLNN